MWPSSSRPRKRVGGGVLAGYPYHLLYVRDQYGVARCLLRLGYFQEAKGILQRDWDIWKRHGKLHNAQAAGVDGVFHVHENDDVEITGYIILQAFDYAKASNDWDFLREILPMLDWALTVQKRHLVHDMLPFNGDETYVAGGILPRNTLNDGSAEATLLFITGGEHLLDWAAKEGAWAKDRIDAEQAVLRRVRDAYRANFLKEGRYITNNPARKEGLALPRFRHGVCEGCYAFGWTERNPHDRYICPKCLATKDRARRADRNLLAAIRGPDAVLYRCRAPQPRRDRRLRERHRGVSTRPLANSRRAPTATRPSATISDCSSTRSRNWTIPRPPRSTNA